MGERAPRDVLIAGAGRAGLEAMLGLHRIAGPRARVTLLAPDQDFVNHALDVMLPFVAAHAPHMALTALAAAGGAELRQGRVTAVEPGAHRVITDAGEPIAYDSLLLAIGAVQRRPTPHTVCFGSGDSPEAMHGLIQDVEAGYVRRIAFVMPAGATWPVPLYELALMTAERAFDQCQPCELTLLTGEQSPLALFGAATSAALSSRLQHAGISVRTAVDVAVLPHGRLEIDGGAERLVVDRVVTVAQLAGPALPGLEHDADGFLVIDEHGRVAGAADVYAAGDVTSGPVKHGSLACRQGDAAAGRSRRRRASRSSPRRPRACSRARC
jgi:sulfide:quinone oxidoreductase